MEEKAIRNKLYRRGFKLVTTQRVMQYGVLQKCYAIADENNNIITEERMSLDDIKRWLEYHDKKEKVRKLYRKNLLIIPDKEEIKNHFFEIISEIGIKNRRKSIERIFEEYNDFDEIIIHLNCAMDRVAGVETYYSLWTDLNPCWQISMLIEEKNPIFNELGIENNGVYEDICYFIESPDFLYEDFCKWLDKEEFKNFIVGLCDK